jgi:hypothetical protein
MLQIENCKEKSRIGKWTMRKADSPVTDGRGIGVKRYAYFSFSFGRKRVTFVPHSGQIP